MTGPVVRAFLCLALPAVFMLVGPEAVRARPESATDAWVSTVVTRIAQADGRSGQARRPGGTVTIRIRIASDGSLEAASIDASSGKAALDARALEAVRAAAPFAPPPARVLTLEGFTELSFPLQFGKP